MDAQAERRVAVGKAVQNNLLGILEHRRVVIGGRPPQPHPLARPNLLPAQFGVAGDRARQHLHRTVVTQELFARGENQLRIVDQALFRLRACAPGIQTCWRAATWWCPLRRGR